MDEILRKLRLDVNALGVWLLGPMVSDGYDPCELLAAAVEDPSSTPPLRAVIEGQTFIALGDRQLYAAPVAGATLVCLFDKRSSLGLIRLRFFKAKAALHQALAARGR